MTMFRFIRKTKKINNDNLYQRGDRTLTYYFSIGIIIYNIEYLHDLMIELGLKEISNEYHTVHLTNRKTGQEMDRVFITSKYQLI